MCRALASTLARLRPNAQSPYSNPSCFTGERRDRVAVPRVFVFSSAVIELRRVLQAIEREGIPAVLLPPSADSIELLGAEQFDALIVDLSAEWPAGEPHDLLRRLPDGTRTLALVPESRLADLPSFAVDDFALSPANAEELMARLRRLLTIEGEGGSDVIRCTDLVIDTANYSVTLGGKPIDLTYKEYELLKFLATNPGRVFTREALLNRVWGYDYFGGSRTVDVHVRRLRSKIEDRHHTFIETVRNVGYRFRTG